jgi:predicted hydrocarbon binding protein
MCAETEAIGWGRISIEEFPGKIVLVSKNGLAAGRNYSGKSPHPVDSYFLGYFEAFLGKLDNTTYYGVETECVAMGDSQCKMEFGTEPVF